MQVKDSLEHFFRDTIFIEKYIESNETLERVFNISPETVYGVLCLLLCIAIMWLAWQLVKSQQQVVNLHIASIEVLKDLNTSLLLIKEQGVSMTTDLKEHIDYTREHLSAQISNIEKQI